MGFSVLWKLNPGQATAQNLDILGKAVFPAMKPCVW